jgi:hypothetical protein
MAHLHFLPPAKIATELIFYVSLAHPTDADSMVSNPAQAAGDWTISKDGGAFSNLATLPAVTPSSSYGLKITLSASEMNATNILVVGKDQTATEEWQAVAFSIRTTAVTVDELLRSTTPDNTIDVDSDGRVDVSTLGGSTAALASLVLAIDTSNNVVKADATRISGDSGAADNAEAFFDGTGYAGGTIKLGVNATQWAGQATSANPTTNLPMVDLDSVDGSTAKATALAAAIDSSGNVVAANVAQISGDSGAADNAEAFFDGTGYAGGTIPLGANVVQISGDANAADALESYCDGTTPIPADVTKISGDATAADNAELAFDGNGFAFTGCSIPTAVSVTNPVTISGTQVHAENTDPLTTSWCLTIGAGDAAHRKLSSGGTLTQYASDGTTPVVTRTQTETELSPA